MRKLFFGFMAMSAMLFTACDDDDETTTPTNPGGQDENVVLKSGEITADETWEDGKVYVLQDRVTVVAGVTLTIEPGVIVKGEFGSGANATALLIARDATINAAGTAQKPIIFTTVSDEIQPGQTVSPNMSADNQGLWGGVIVLGNAKISASAAEVQIEGIPTSDQNGLYGGSDDSDNSGVLKYISIRHGGSNIGAGNEINGLTMGGVGTGTVVENIEVVANADDGIEWFGGSVDVTNALVWNCGDDGLDSDQDWIGTCENFMIISPTGGSAFELDGPEGSLNRGVHTFKNGVVYAGDAIDHLVDWDDNTNAEVIDVYFWGWSESYGPAMTDDGPFAPIETFGGDGQGNSSNWEYTLTPNGAPVDSIFKGVPAAALTEVSGPGAKSVGPEDADFSWTWASQSGALSGLGL